MTGFQLHSAGGSRSKPLAFGAAALVCLALLALLAVVQVGHMHPIDSQADHCQLCIVMHSAAPVAVAAAIIVLVAIQTSAPVFEARTVVRHRHPKLFTRPPPAGC